MFVCDCSTVLLNFNNTVPKTSVPTHCRPHQRGAGVSFELAGVPEKGILGGVSAAGGFELSRSARVKKSVPSSALTMASDRIVIELGAASAVGQALKEAGETVAIVEATAGGLITASLQSRPKVRPDNPEPEPEPP